MVKVGNLDIAIGSVIVQSMCNTRTADIDSTVEQIKALEAAGCELIRVAVPDMDSARAISKIREQINIPIVADIHFDYRLAIESANHADKIRINPGNLGPIERFIEVINAAKENNIAIRIGVNLGSLNKDIEKKYGRTPEAMVESALEYTRICEDNGFDQIVVSLKASDVMTTIRANRLFREKSNYPLHIGITEAGTMQYGTIKSAVGIGALLADGIGETIRVSLAADPVQEIPVAFSILKSLGLRKGVEVIACPTCARTHGDLIGIAEEIEKKTLHINKDIKIAVMGCEVNGPGEAMDADVGVALCENEAVIFQDGKLIKRVRKEEIVEEMVKEIGLQ